MSPKDPAQLHLLCRRTPRLLPWLCFHDAWGLLPGTCVSPGSLWLLWLRGTEKNDGDGIAAGELWLKLPALVRGLDQTTLKSKKIPNNDTVLLLEPIFLLCFNFYSPSTFFFFFPSNSYNQFYLSWVCFP